MRIAGTHEQIMNQVRAMHPEIDDVLARVTETIPYYKRAISAFQGAGLYAVAKPYNHMGGRCLEIGTAWGYSAAILAQALPDCEIITLNPKAGEMERAADHLRVFPNVTVLKHTSGEYLEMLTESDRFDFMFVDGDHQHVAADMPYYDYLLDGGLMFHHDYAPLACWRPCPPVYEVINRVCDALGLAGPNVLVVDDDQVGMAGIMKQPGTRWSDWGIPADFAPWHVEYEPVKRWVRSTDG